MPDGLQEIEFPSIGLSAGKVALRPWQSSDAVAQAAWGGDSEIVRWTTVPAHYDAKMASEYIAWAEDERIAGRSISFAIVSSATGELYGWCDLRRPTKDPQVGEVGYFVSEPFRRQGICSTSLSLLLGFAFGEAGFARIQAMTEPENTPSSALLISLGFQHEGVLREYRAAENGRLDLALYARLAGDRWS